MWPWIQLLVYFQLQPKGFTVERSTFEHSSACQISLEKKLWKPCLRRIMFAGQSTLPGCGGYMGKLMTITWWGLVVVNLLILRKASNGLLSSNELGFQRHSSRHLGGGLWAWLYHHGGLRWSRLPKGFQQYRTSVRLTLRSRICLDNTDRFVLDNFRNALQDCRTKIGWRSLREGHA